MTETAIPKKTKGPGAVRTFFELIGSMRFAISLLVFICMASLLGTVLTQGEDPNTYINQFGPFWYAFLNKFSIWTVYNSWWFMTIMGFLIVSVSLCVIRNGPRMLRDAGSFKEYARASSLRAFPHRLTAETVLSCEQTVEASSRLLRRLGYGFRVRRDEDGIMLAAKKGSANRLGYICAHVAIVVICIGGLLDSGLPLRLVSWLGGKQPIVQNMRIADVPESGRLPLGNPSFRAAIQIPEGSQASDAVITQGRGALVQPLPFVIKLNKFIINYYPTGMPSRFASDVHVTDLRTGKQFDDTIEVNKPLKVDGETVFQSSFADGGSAVTLRGYSLQGGASQPFTVDGKVGADPLALSAAQMAGHDGYHLSIEELRPINVEDMSSGQPKPAQSLGHDINRVLGSADGLKTTQLRNVGPSVRFSLIDTAGQPHEFENYMLPIVLDGFPVFLAGVSDGDGAPFRYLRIPADDDNSLDDFMRLRAALQDPAMRAEAAQRFVADQAPAGVDRTALQQAAQRALDTFASGGLQAIAQLLQHADSSPQNMNRAVGLVVQLLGGALAELRNVELAHAGLPAVPTQGPDAARAAQWLRLATAALSDLTFYPAPVFFTLSNFHQVQASVFQISRSPGTPVVYVGCLLLLAGVFSLFYIRDRRIWIYVRPEAAGSHVMAAMTSQKRTLDFEREFERFQASLQQTLQS